MELKHWMAAQNFDTDECGNVAALVRELDKEAVTSAFWSDFLTVSGTRGMGWFGGQFEDGFAPGRNAPAWCKAVLDALAPVTRERLLDLLNEQQTEEQATAVPGGL